MTQPVANGLGVDSPADGLVPLTEAPAGANKLVGRLVDARGTESGRSVALAGGELQATGGQTAAAVSGTKSVAVLLFNFAGDLRQPWTAATVRSVVFDGAGSVNAYYQDASYGKVSVAGDVYGWFTIDAGNSGCDYTTWAGQARSKAQAAGVPLGNYTYTVYAFPSASGCGWSGLAYLPGTSSWINGSMTLRTVGHELGHNFGVHHASSFTCTDSTGTRVMLSATCSASEYGDPFTIMGASSRLHNDWHRAQLGWLTDVQTVTTSGVYTLAPAESASASPKLIRIARGDGTYLNLEFRQPSGTFDGFAASDPVVNGVSIRIAPDFSSLVQSKLIDANPATSTFADAPFGAGRSLVDPVSGVTVSTTAVAAAGATVSIQFGSDTQAPTQPGSLTATALSSSSVKLAWTASSDNRGVAGYRIYRGGTLVTTTTSLTWTDTGLTPGTAYGYEVRAYDAAGNVSTAATASATTSAGDTTAPSAPGNLTATLAQRRRVNLAWSAATDNVGVAGYRVYRNGTQVTQVTARSFRDTPGRGTYTYTVKAFDAAGNVGSPSNAVTVTVPA